jgi:hypothetical protein
MIFEVVFAFSVYKMSWSGMEKRRTRDEGNEVSSDS